MSAHSYTLRRYKARVSVLLQNGNHVVEDRFYLRETPFKALEAVEDDCKACNDKLVSVQVYGQGGNDGVWNMVPCVTKGNPYAKKQQDFGFVPSEPRPKRPTLADVFAEAEWAWYSEIGPCVYPILKPKTSHVLSGETK